MTITLSRSQLISNLQQQVRSLEGFVDHSDARIISTGCPRLDQFFPAGGLRRGSLVEWVKGGRGSGASLLSLLAARQLCVEGGIVAIIDRSQSFYPLAAQSLGLDPDSMLIIRPRSLQEESWAIEQTLRCSAIAAVWGCIDQIGSRIFRRWQLAAEEGGSVGLFVRSPKCLRTPTWAEVSLQVRPCATASFKIYVETLRSHGSHSGRSAEFEVDEITATIR